MTLGERIFKFRTGKNMSQGELAEALEVSRQSVSKWETDASVPELDKLVKLSELFGVSLDELVLEKKATEQPPTVVYAQHRPLGAKKITGIVLLILAVLVFLIPTVQGSYFLNGLIYALPFLSCGLICLFVQKNVILWCGWAVYSFFDFYWRHASGSVWFSVFYPSLYTQPGLTRQLILAWGLFVSFAVLGTVTVVRFRKDPPLTLKHTVIAVIVSWVICFLPWPFSWPIAPPSFAHILYRLSFALFGCVKDAALFAALFFTDRLILIRRNQKREQGT